MDTKLDNLVKKILAQTPERDPDVLAKGALRGMSAAEIAEAIARLEGGKK